MLFSITLLRFGVNGLGFLIKPVQISFGLPLHGGGSVPFFLIPPLEKFIFLFVADPGHSHLVTVPPNVKQVAHGYNFFYICSSS